MSRVFCLEKLCLLLISIVGVVNTARILGIIHVPAYGHFLLGDRIYRELALRGHQVTIISPFDKHAPVENLTHIFVSDLMSECKEFMSTILDQIESNSVAKAIWYERLGNVLTKSTLKHPNVQGLLNSNATFDLVIYINFINEAFSGFAYHYKVPYVLMSTFGPTRWTNLKMGNPNNPAYIPDILLSYTSKMSFWERMVNSLMYLVGLGITNWYTYPTQDKLLQEYFPGAPPVYDLVYNASLLLITSHPSIEAPIPLVPNIIDIAGCHVQSPKPLPKDLQDYLDNAKDGAILFSLGSIIQSTGMSEEKRNAIFKPLEKLQQKVIMKWEIEDFPEKPRNVKAVKWLPQADILAHPNIRLFVTHAGLFSIIEATHRGVPLLGIPVVNDQTLNMVKIKERGCGIGIPYTELTEERLSVALSEMLNNNTYFDNAKKMSVIMRDQQTQPLDRAMYWIEYVIRHQGASHLRTSALDLSWFQYLLLDVVVVISVGIVIIIWVIWQVTKWLCRRKCENSATRDKKLN